MPKMYMDKNERITVLDEIIEEGNKTYLTKNGVLYTAEIIETDTIDFTSEGVEAFEFIELGNVIIKLVKINYAVSGVGGSIIAIADGNSIESGTQLDEGASVSFTSTPEFLYNIKDWKLNGVTVNGSNSEYVLNNIMNDVNVITSFEEIEPYTLSFNNISASGRTGNITGNSNAQTVPRNGVLHMTTNISSGSPTISWVVNGTNRSGNTPIEITGGQSLAIRTVNNGNSEGNITIRWKDNSGPIVSSLSFKLERTGNCFLTTAMVDYYGLEDDGPELTAMRDLRSKYREKHAVILSEYYEDSIIIIEKIEEKENKDDYYSLIKSVVDQIVVLVKNKEWSVAEQLYLDLYYELKGMK